MISKETATVSSLPTASASMQVNRASKYIETSAIDLPYTTPVQPSSRDETKSSSNNSSIPFGDSCVGTTVLSVDPQTQVTSTSYTRSSDPNLFSSCGSGSRQESSNSSQTTGGSAQILRSTNVAHAGVYMPNIDLLHIGAQFENDFVEDYGHTENSSGKDLGIALETQEQFTPGSSNSMTLERSCKRATKYRSDTCKVYNA